MKDDKAAELLAAVRAVESGERSAAEFFTQPAPAAAPAADTRPQQQAGQPEHDPRRPDAPAAARPVPEAAPGQPVAVPEGVRAVLAGGGAPETLAVPLVEALGEQAEEVLRADPWQLLAVPAVRPEQADAFARALLGPECGPGDARRSRALLVRLLERAALAGHTVLEPEALAKGLSGHGVPHPEDAVRDTVDAGAVLVLEDTPEGAAGEGAPGKSAPGEDTGDGSAEGSEGDAEERPVRLLMGLERYALAEESLADGLMRVAGTFGQPDGTHAAGETPDANAAREAGAGEEPAGAAAWEAAAAAAPSPSAAELIRTVAQAGLVAHTGGEAARAEPAALLAAARRMGLRAYGVAHTPDGRDRLARARDASGAADPGAADTEPATPEVPGGASGVATVAELLSGAAGPGRQEDGTWALDLLVVCDAPQLDAETAENLVESLPDGVRLVLSGDPQLLGPAGAGRVFADVRAARGCPVVVSRTPDPGPVGELVSGIGIGELAAVDAPGKEVVIVPVKDAGEAVLRAVQLVADSVPRAIGVPADRTQVITPEHGGAAGTRALNAALKERLNPGPGRFGGFDPGDRVAYSPVPGRTTMGTVRSGDDEGLRLDCAPGDVVVPPGRVAGTVRHGWAVTAHQAVGTRWPAAVVVLPGDATGALTREWVYTAFGRGEQHLSVVHGADAALPHAVASVHAPVPTTRLRMLLEQAARAEAEARAQAAGSAPREGA